MTITPALMPMGTQQASPQGAPRTQKLVLAIMVAVFLLIFASRVERLPTMNMEADEVWTVWQTFGTLQQTLIRTPYDWTPGHYLLVHIWRFFTGIDPFTLRIMTVLNMLLCAALLYRLTRKLYGIKAAILTVLAFSSFGYMLFLSTILRGYLLSLTLWILAFWITLHYFERPSDKPSRKLGIFLGLTITAMFYVHVTAVFGVVMLVIYTLIFYPRKLRQWILPGIITAVLCLPEIISKLYVVGIKGRLIDHFIPYLAPQVQSANLYIDFAGQEWTLWVALFVIASALFLERWRLKRQTFMLIIWMLLPLPLFWVTSRLEAFHPRHLHWVMVGFAIWIGVGLSRLPRAALLAVGLIMAVGMFGYIPISERYEVAPRSPLVMTFEALRPDLRMGDVIMLDPKCAGCANVTPEEWDYFIRAYFPTGLTFIKQMDQSSRIWYVAADGKEDPSVFDQLNQSRALTTTLGDNDLLFRLYEAPPDPAGLLFANGMRFNGAEILNEGGDSMVWHEDETVKLRLWWSVDQTPGDDFSEGSYLFNQDGSVASQFDGPPQTIDGPQKTSQWLPKRYYIEERTLKLPYPLATSFVPLKLAVYNWRDDKRITAPGLEQDNLLTLSGVYVRTWSNFALPAITPR